jgi:UDP-N-acetylmuramyl pentapeptide phosphotransferase/UDP-N-acetylglucosamine-1-phosphate transferase
MSFLIRSQFFTIIGGLFLAAAVVVFIITARLTKKLGKNRSMEDDLGKHLIAKPPSTPERKRILTLRKIALLLILIAVMFLTIGGTFANVNARRYIGMYR